MWAGGIPKTREEFLVDLVVWLITVAIIALFVIAGAVA